MLKQILSILLFLFWALGLTAQKNSSGIQDCNAILREAETAYQSGMYTDCIRTLEGILDSCDLSRRQKSRTLEMLAKAYVEAGETGKAETTVNLLLRNFPHYELREAENPEMFNRLVNKYIIHPRFSIGIKNTIYTYNYHSTKAYSVLDGLDYIGPAESEEYAFTYFGTAEYEFAGGFALGIDGMTFTPEYKRFFWNSTGFNLLYKEEDRFIVFPVYLKKYFHAGKDFCFYLSGGIGPFYTLSAEGSAAIEYTKADIFTGKNADFESTWLNIDVLEMKNRMTAQWNAGAGFGYLINNLRLFVDIRFLGGLSSITEPERSDLNPQLKNDYFYMDNEMKFNHYEAGVTISYTLFNSVKRKKPL